MSKTLLAALAGLDPANDNHWTAEGAPRLDTLKFMTGTTVTREMVTSAAPTFTRAAPTLPSDAAAAPAQAPAAPADTTGGGSTTPPAGEPPVAAQAAAQTESTQPGAGDVTQVQAGSVTQPNTQGVQGDQDDEAPETELEAAQRVLAEANARFAQADRDVKAAAAECDRLIEAQHVARPGETLADAVKSYHAGQRKTLERRAQQIQALKGINIAELLPKRAPIDTALARKTGRGTQRPKF